MFKLYSMPTSGNCYKVAFLLHLLDQRCEIVAANTLAGETKTEAFLLKNPAGQIPLLEIITTTTTTTTTAVPNSSEETTTTTTTKYLSESNAILLYLAEQFPEQGLLPFDDPWQRAKVYQWLFFEQYSHEPTIAVRRANFVLQRNYSKEKLATLLEGGRKALQVMETQLQQTSYLVGDTFTVADLSLYAYTHVAHEGGYVLPPAVEAWVTRIQTTLPRYKGLEILQENSI